MVHDEEVFVSSITPCIGAVIGVVLCETEQAAHTAANLIQIEYELLTPTIFTIEDAITHGSYLCDEQCLQQGDVDKALAEADHKLEGTLMIGGQEHFYMEPNCFLVVPSKDDKEVALYFGTQDPCAAQLRIGMALGRPANRITCHVKRIGGAFGGKEGRA
jgi:xanthine dehydrogenase molybdopterin-binding subunit B